jgi:hypothetical protein
MADKSACEYWLGVAYRCMEVAERMGSARPATDFFDRPRLDGLRGSSLLLINRPTEARDVLVRALHARDPSNVKGRALLQLDVAESLVQEDEPDEACAIIDSVMTIPVDAQVGRFELDWRSSPVASIAGRIVPVSGLCVKD